MKAIKLCLLLCCVASLSWGQVRITEVNTTSGDITLTNMGGSVEDVSVYWLCNFPAYDEISTLPLVSGSTMLMAGMSVTVTWSDAVAATGECGLYNTNSFTSAAAIEDYMEWEVGGNTREFVAVSAGVWCTGEFATGASPYSFTGGATDYCSAFWTGVMIPGCTDSTYDNYDSTATVDDGSCGWNVDFSVDMNNYVPGFVYVNVSGAWNGWCGDCNQLTDPDLDGVWEGTFPIPDGNYQFKYSVDNWAADEPLAVGAGWACTVQIGDFINRDLTVSGAGFSIGTVCWNSCNTCPGAGTPGCMDTAAQNFNSLATESDGTCEYLVTFQVNMANYGPAFGAAEVNGAFNGWCGNCNAMTDANLDDIWDVEIQLVEGWYEYKYSLDAWADQEGLTPGDACVVTNFGNTNRNINVSGDTVQPVVCWHFCVDCVASAGCMDTTANNYDSTAMSDDGSCTYDVIFTVDMNNYGTAGVDYILPEVNGSFNGWCGGCDALADPELDGVWTTTLSLSLGSYEYQFAIDAWTDQEFGLDPLAACTLGANRLVDVLGATDIGEVCWESCSACVVGAGCTDAAAANYDSTAGSDDGSCEFLVDFSVDMNSFGGGFTGVSVFGTFNAWDVNANLLADGDLDGVWTATVQMTNGAQEFKYAIDGPPGQENFLGTEPCIVGADPFWNRSLNVPGNVTLPVVCYNSCDACLPSTAGCMDTTANNYDSTATSDDGSCMYDVIFTVDMNEYLLPFTTPEVNGGFNGWCGGCAPMADPELDGVWTLTISLPAGNHEYKFAVDSWTDQEFPVGSCMLGANRLVVVTTATDIGEVCWESCFACGVLAGCMDTTANNYDSTASLDDGSCQYDVIFTVDMNNYGTAGVDYILPEVNGGFNGWCGGCNALSDPELDGIWTTTLSLAVGSYDYQFAIDAWTDQEFGLDPAAPCTNGANRFVDVTGVIDIGLVCWESCVACVAMSGCMDTTANNYDSTASTDDGSCTYDVIFSVDMNTYAPAFTTPEVNGGFNGWCGGCAPMVDPELDGVWTVTISLPAGNHEYKFAVDSWNDQEFPAGPCMLGANRLIVVSTATDIGVVCWGSCDACPTPGCTDPAYTEFDPYAGIDDGSCATLVVEGCIYSAANNYDSTANTDDGSCMFDACVDSCPGDFDDNLSINTADLLTFLTFFGTTCTP
jgi:1,4-alpha-glucan branching enzyme